jgi:hypothetical protein
MVLFIFLINLPHILTLIWENSSHLHFIVPILKLDNLQFWVLHYRVYHQVTGHTDLKVSQVAGTVFKLSSCLPSSVSSLPCATKFFFLPNFHFGRDFVLAHCPVQLFFEILLLAWSSRTLFSLSDFALRVLLVLSGIWWIVCSVD